MMKENTVRGSSPRPIGYQSCFSRRAFVSEESDVSAKDYSSIERPNSIKMPLTGNPRVPA